eukprot:6513830-Pyramimonas_sp.AAC.1
MTLVSVLRSFGVHDSIGVSRSTVGACPIDMGLLLRARARLREGKATGLDGISASVLKALP